MSVYIHCILLLLTLPLHSAAEQTTTDFERDVAPILLSRCIECHQSANPSGGLSLQTATAQRRGGDSGPAVRPGDADGSLLISRVLAGEMPPPANGHERRLPPAEAETLRRWVTEGATFPAGRVLDLFEKTLAFRGGRDWWSFQPLSTTAPPEPVSIPWETWRQHPIDRFLAAGLQRSQLSPAPPATARELIRRLYWDLTGLPPQSSDTELAIRMEQAGARTLTAPQYQQLVDRLLASSAYGERWARHWLDVARYADTSGYERDQPKPFAWKYRDWVVQALNADLPWDQFVRLQLAGDEVPDRSEQTVIATGFLRLGTWNDEPNDPEDYVYERLEDLVHTTSSAFLGLTVKCARCHDHKFDPIPQADYYQFAAAFWPGPLRPGNRTVLGGPDATALGFPDVLGWTDMTRQPEPLQILKNGERDKPLRSVSAGPLSCLPQAGQNPFAIAPTATTTQLRLQLANWIASPQNSLAARVIVNRIWMHHFGEGLVRSTSNFGFTGERPSHPELLDWLAGELLRSGGSLKHIHRLILTSEAWQQSVQHPDESRYSDIDADNRWLWRGNRRRQDAESLRDAILAASGELDLKTGGPGFVPTLSSDALEGLSRKDAAWTASPADEQRRRSLYMYLQRSLQPPMMTTFDQCDTTISCGRRDVSIVAPQALTLMNNQFLHERAQALAKTTISTSDPAARVNHVWKAFLHREPSADELAESLSHLRKQQQQLTHSLQQLTQQHRDSPSLNAVSPGVAAACQQIAAPADKIPQMPEVRLFLDAASGVRSTADGHLESWLSRDAEARTAAQTNTQRQPTLGRLPNSTIPAVIFDGQGSFLQLGSGLLQHESLTVFAVATDRGVAGHRELLSNWSGRDGNSTSSLFVGLTADRSFRFSDDLSGVGELQQGNQPFLLTATNGPAGASLFQGIRKAVSRPGALAQRRLDTPWVIGQQGNIDGEYWNGHLSLLIVFGRQLSADEQLAVQTTISRRFSLPLETQPAQSPADPEQLALASLCLVLFNTNEFAFID